MSVELAPRYQSIVDDYGDGCCTYTVNDIVLSHKWVYNYGGFDFWLRGEHTIRGWEDEWEVTRDTESEDGDYLTHTLHAAWEVKF